MIDGFTTSDMYPYARHYRLGDVPVNYLRNSVKVIVDAYDGTVTFYVFDSDDPIIAAYRSLFPTLFVDGSRMPADVRAHVRYPELLLKVQAAAFGLYHMRDPEVFYNREDLWSVASEVTLSEDREQVDAADRAELRADEAAGRDVARVRRDPAVHAGQPEQPDRVDRRPQRRPELRQGDRATTSRSRGSWTARCRSRPGSTRIRSSPRS